MYRNLSAFLLRLPCARAGQPLISSAMSTGMDPTREVSNRLSFFLLQAANAPAAPATSAQKPLSFSFPTATAVTASVAAPSPAPAPPAPTPSNPSSRGPEKESQEKKEKASKVAVAPPAAVTAPAIDPAREQLAQQLAATQKQLAEVEKTAETFKSFMSSEAAAAQATIKGLEATLGELNGKVATLLEQRAQASKDVDAARAELAAVKKQAAAASEAASAAAATAASSIRALEAKVTAAGKDNAAKDAEIAAQKRRLDVLTGERDTAAAQAASAGEKVKELTAKLAAQTEESQKALAGACAAVTLYANAFSPLLCAAEVSTSRGLGRDLESVRAKLADAGRVEASALRAAEESKREVAAAVAAAGKVKSELEEAKAGRAAATHGKEEAEKALAAEKKTVRDAVYTHNAVSLTHPCTGQDFEDGKCSCQRQLNSGPHRLPAAPAEIRGGVVYTHTEACRCECCRCLSHHTACFPREASKEDGRRYACKSPRCWCVFILCVVLASLLGVVVFCMTRLQVLGRKLHLL